CAAIQVPEHPLVTLRASHPRLIVTDADFIRLRQFVRSDNSAARLYASLKYHADQMLTQPTVVHRLIGPRLLDQSRLCLERVYTLALVYRISGETKYLERAVTELRAAAAFPDWNPSHFLDVAEMTHAFAIGYDWLYQNLSPEDRALFRRAIAEKGLDEAIKAYKQHKFWTTAVHNWNQVCNGGITLGALAIADEEHDRAEYLVKQSIDSIQLAMASYAPEGGWAEGPGYWQYATSYNVYYLAALQSALGTDFGLSSLPGFAHAGDFRIYFQGPAGTFNYADAHPPAGTAPEMFWLAHRFSQPVFAWDELQHLISSGWPTALDLVWGQLDKRSPSAANWPLKRMFQGVNVAFLRSDWESPDAFWIGVKGGDNHANHSHLDLGSFVFDARGVRWALDLGSDNYNLPGYFGRQRYTYYRLRTESHNTVLIDGENQDPTATAPMTMQNGIATIDLAAAYPGKVTKFVRTVELTHEKTVIIRDEIKAPKPVEALWGMVTDAQVTINHNHAKLEKNSSTLEAEIIFPKGAVFDTVSTTPPSPEEDQNKGTRKLVVRLKGKVTSTVIEVIFR
ncbi:MAG: heparinase, partial [Acidobacteria bacterium]